MKNKCIALYLRSATGNEADLTRQKRSLQRECASRKLDLNRGSFVVYSDPCLTGMKSGPNLLRIKQDIAADKIHTVMTFDLNRISRDSRQVDLFLDCLEEHGARLVCRVNVDSNSCWAETKKGGTNG